MRKIIHIALFIIQYCFYYLITPVAYLLYSKKRPWIICERGDDARDNGYFFFKHLHDEQIIYINKYYLIKKKSCDFHKVNKLGSVVEYKSLKHWLLYRVSECRLTTHLAAFAPGNYIGEYFKHHKQKGINVFLQHGITHNEFLSTYFEHNGSDLFICGAKPEFEFITTNCHFPDNNVVYTGFSRFDELHHLKLKNQILIMPSWRSYLRGVSNKEFVQSKFFMYFNSLLNNRNLNQWAKNNNGKIVFYIHYSLKEYIDCFNFKNNPYVVIADFNHYDVQTLLKDSKLLITDYSSVFFDFAYMYKPTIYYQFDAQDFYDHHYKKSYFDHKRDGFGEVASNENELLNVFDTYTKNDFKLKDRYKFKIDAFFTLHDTNNSKRILDCILNKIVEKQSKTKMSKVPTYLTFTGDDYGRNKQSTIGINEAYKKGFIQQTSLMVNRNDSDQKYIDLVPKYNIVFHFNVIEGNRLNDARGEWFYNVDKNTISKRIVNKKAYVSIKREDKRIIEEELNNQINKYIKMGFECFAFDSHGHIHHKLPIAKLIIPKCIKYGFKVARIPMNIRRNHWLFDFTYKKHIIHLYRKSFLTTDYFCNCYDLIHLNLNKYKGKVIEVMTHPFISSNRLENRRDVNFDLIQKHLSKYNIQIISITELSRIKKIK